jgi:single-strand DNA-binding protein
MMLPQFFGEMRIAGDPALRFTPSGQAVANFRLVATKRKKVEKDGVEEWVDAAECWVNGTLWGRAAENAVESLESGTLVEVRGVLETRNYETKDGEKRTSIDVNLYSITPSLAYATAKVSKVERTTGSDAPAGATQSGSAAPADDPWVTAPSSDEPPF